MKRSAIKSNAQEGKTQKAPSNGCFFSVVEPEGFEPSSKHSTVYAFYMLSFPLLVGGKEGGKRTCTNLRSCGFSPVLSNVTPARSVVRCPGCLATDQCPAGQRL